MFGTFKPKPTGGGKDSKAATPVSKKQQQEQDRQQQQQQDEGPAVQQPASEEAQVAAAEAAEAPTPSDSKAAERQAAAVKQEQNQQQQKQQETKLRSCGQQKQAASKPADDMETTDSDGSDDDDMEDAEAAEAEDSELDKTTAAFKAAFKQPGKRTSSKTAAAASGGSKVDGVGTGALQAAKQAVGVDIKQLITWKEGQPVPYAFLAETFQTIAGTTKRLEIISCLTAAFRAILASTPADLLPAVYLCTNRVAPAHTGTELGVGDSILIKALAQSTGRKESSIKADYESTGDLGSVAAACRGQQRTMFPAPPLTIAGVLKTFREIAKASGQSSQERKRGLIGKLLVASKGSEPGYIIRSLQAKLRIGLAEQSVLVAIAHAVLLHKEGAKDKDGRLADRLEQAAQVVKQAYSECPTCDVLIPALLGHPVSEVCNHVHFMPGVPVKPMLAKPTAGVSEVLDKFTGIEFTCEYKYDGERVQIHVQDGGKKVHIYSRNSEDMTPRYPDIVSRLPGWLTPGTKSIVIDGEAVAWDQEKNKILPFQVLSTRARKEVALADVKVHVCVFAFDCLYHNGTSLLHEPLTKRREVLNGALVEVAGQVSHATTKISNDVEELEAFLNEAVDASTEGLIVKTLNDTYEPSKRSSHWLKLKKDYLQGVGDTFDVVPIGAFYGRGKRAGVFGAYLLAVYDDESETYQTISKLGTGFSEEQLVQLADSLRPAIIPAPRPYYQYGESGVPDVWFEPTQVWEVKAADLSISPLHQAALGMVEPGKGISIRFPRLVRVRDDKNPEDATTASQVADMYRQQAVVQAEAKAKAGDDGDYE
eukprot:GHUV01011215.1.p1 GENE.GHUV01011215.1~~GHUV01011215.1.p1  ORF type:complete len:820 (+),score=334.68 GHUV01011215.1:667-3126(+)